MSNSRKLPVSLSDSEDELFTKAADSMGLRVSTFLKVGAKHYADMILAGKVPVLAQPISEGVQPTKITKAQILAKAEQMRPTRRAKAG